MRATKGWWCIILAACDGGELVNLDIDHYQVPCLDETLHLCLRVRESENDDWQRFFDTVEGYDHGWGTVRTIETIKRRKIVQDGSEAYGWEFSQVLDERPVGPGTTFVYPFRPQEADPADPALTIDGDAGALMDGKPFTCETAELCAEVEGWLVSNASVVVTMQYGDPIDGPLKLTAVTATQ